MSKDVIIVNVNDPIIDPIKLLKHNDIGRLRKAILRFS